MAPPDRTEAELLRLREENRELKERLDALERRGETTKKARARLMRGGFRLLLPLFDRQRVVRSFGKLAETASDFTEPPHAWPAKEQVLADTRDFLESVVRFMVRRRLAILVFSLLAAAIPAIQVWLVVQQNEIIENQNEFFEIQVYDLVARSMTEGDHNARVMTGALLANADLTFLEGVVQEAFDPELAAGTYRAASVDAPARRLEDAAFRGYLVRATVRAVQRQAGERDPDALLEEARALFRPIVADAADRIPQVLRLGRRADDIDGELIERVDNYLLQVGALLRTYGRLARSAGERERFHADLEPLLARLSGRSALAESPFAPVYRTVLQDFLFEVAVGPELGDPPVDLRDEGIAPEEAVRRGIDALREEIGQDAVAWDQLAQQLAPQGG